MGNLLILSIPNAIILANIKTIYRKCSTFFKKK
jgi:hypothetical protein